MTRKNSMVYLGILMMGWTGVAFAGTTVSKQLVVGGLSRPMYVTHAPNDFKRIFVIEQRGAIRVILNGQLLATPFLDIDSLVLGGTSGGDERGMLGLAFHPNFAQNGFFYVNYYANNNTTVVARYQVLGDPMTNNVASPSSGDIIMTFSQPFSNHNGGWMNFGPDGYMYISTGDGGSANDPNENAQNKNVLLGKMLRIDVNGDDFPADPNKDYRIPPDNPFVGVTGLDEIWAYGLRNPWRSSFDRLTGDLWIADVGQNAWEEINFQAASSAGGENYGWDCKEGNACITVDVGCSCTQAGLVNPIHVYSHASGNCSVTGGKVYRGCAIPDLQGVYFFGDYCSRRIWSFRYVNGQMSEFTDRTAQLGSLSLANLPSFGEDAYGEIYFTDLIGGNVWRIVATATGEDCDNNGKVDACEILDGSKIDADDNGIPDECEIPLSIVSSNPPDGAIDARQPSDPNGSNPAGISTVSITFDGPADGVVAGDFTVEHIGSAEAPPQVLAVVLTAMDTVLVILNKSIAVGAWTTIHYEPNPTQQVRIGYLPADVNGDGISTVPDVLSLIDHLNNVITLPIYSADINRSGVADPADILRAIDLLNGADQYPKFLGASLPPMP